MTSYESFGEWFELAAAATSAPAAAGVFQVRLQQGLADYPDGRSAMLYYGRAADLSAGIAAFRARVVPTLEQDETALWVRWLAVDAPDLRLRQLFARFEARFGSLPFANAAAARG
ncbi:MAG TPA: hypothetical protein VGC54_10120 [Planctomycetota bacterium]